MPKAYVLKTGKGGKLLPVLALPVGVAADGSVTLPDKVKLDPEAVQLAGLSGIVGSTLIVPAAAYRGEGGKPQFVVLYGTAPKPGTRWRDWTGTHWDVQTAIGKVIEVVRGMSYDGTVRPPLEIVLQHGLVYTNIIEQVVGETLELANAFHGLENFGQEVPKLPSIDIVERLGNPSNPDVLEAMGGATGERVNWARRLSTQTSNRQKPADLMAELEAVATTQQDYVRTIERLVGVQDLQAAGYNLAAVVGQGSKHEPHNIVLEYCGAGPDAPWVDIIGKGVTYDSGGLYMKGPPGANDMHQDMAGAAVAAATFFAAVDWTIEVNLRLRVMAVENMVDSNAMRNGDVERCDTTGLSIRIAHSDAEGRLVLLPQIGKAKQAGAGIIITVATLTGAAHRAFTNGTCFWVRSQDPHSAHRVAKTIEGCADDACERVWQQPWDPSTLDMLKKGAEGADYANIVNGRLEGGHQLAAEFLGLALGDDFEGTFLHFDIAAGHKNQKTDGVNYAGGEAPMVRTLVRYLQHLAELNEPHLT